jgi:Leucine-rich repeat (LRR) protein
MAVLLAPRVAKLAILVSLGVGACGGQAERNPHDGAPIEEPGPLGSGGVTNAGGGAEHGPVSNPPKPAGNAGSSASSGGGEGGSLAGGVAGAAGIADGGDPEAGGVGAGGEPPVINCDPIVFQDPDLEAVVRAEVNKPAGALTSADVAGLTYLETQDITSLEGVQCLTDLTSLDIGSLPPGDVTDLSPLAGLTKLEDVSVARNPLASVEPLGKLPKLKTLFMFSVPVTLDLTPLATAPALEYLDMQSDTVVDLAPLGKIATLHTLHMRSGKVLHPEGAAALENVVDLDVGGVFTDATPLAGLTKLQKLRIGQTTLQHFDKLSGLVNLLYLDFAQAGIDNLSPLKNMTKLVNMNAASNQISDVGPLAGLPQLGFVVLVGNQISDVTALAANPAIGSGDFVYLNKNAALSCAAQAANIQSMRARGADVSSDCP